MRPKSIIMFDRLYLASIAGAAVAIMVAMVMFSTMDGQMENALRDAGFQGSAESFMTVFAIGYAIFALLFQVVIPLILWHFAARRGSEVAKWMVFAYAILSLLGLLMALAGLAMGEQQENVLPSWIVYAGYQLLHFASIWFLLKSDSTLWFRGGGRAPQQEIFR